MVTLELGVKFPGVAPYFSRLKREGLRQIWKPRFPFVCSGTHLVLWVADEVAQLSSLLVQLIDDNIPPFSHVEKASVFIYSSLCLVHHNAWWLWLGGNGEDVHVSKKVGGVVDGASGGRQIPV